MLTGQKAKEGGNIFEDVSPQKISSESKPVSSMECQPRTIHSASLNPDPLVIALIDSHVFTRECVATCLQTLCTDARIATFANVAEYMDAGQNIFDVVFFYLRDGFVQGQPIEASVSALSSELQSVALVVVSDSDDPKASLDALSAGARGFIPSSTMSPALTIEVIRLVRAGGMFAPVNIPLMRQANGHTKDQQTFDHLGAPSHQFTPRQLSVLEHLQRGSANKIIAHELALSEGTVKVHVRNIMKKLRATNRTQAVSRSYKIPAREAVAEVTAGAPPFRAGEFSRVQST